jgi:hypothetical protein
MPSIKFISVTVILFVDYKSSKYCYIRIAKAEIFLRKGGGRREKKMPPTLRCTASEKRMKEKSVRRGIRF